MRRAAISSLALVFASVPALATNPWVSNPGSQPGSTLDQPPEPKETEPHHSGVFIRSALGPGYFYASNKSFSANGDRRVFQAGSASLQLAVGGTTRSGFVVIGGGYSRDSLFALTSRDTVVDGDEPDLEGYGMTLHRLGLFTDTYFGAHSGTHAQLFVARGWLSVSSPTNGGRDNPGGYVVQVGLGHEFWLDDSVLLGALFAVSYGWLTVNETGSETTLRTILPTLSLTATLN